VLTPVSVSQVNVPLYATIEHMRAKLLLAISECTSITS
jgi:hypothetical protein